MYQFLLPDIGEGISEAILIDWTVKVGDVVAEGEEIASVSTDKVDVELPSPRTGTIAELCWKPGDTIPVGSVLIRIDVGDAPETVDHPWPGSAPRSDDTPSREIPGSTASAGEDVGWPRAAGKAGAIIASPSTRKLAAGLDVDLSTVEGSGPEGQITRVDVEQVAGTAKSTEQAPPRPGGTEVREPIRGVRAVMGRQMAQSVHLYAHSTISFEVEAGGFVALLGKFTANAPDGVLRISVTALLMKCVSAALSLTPRFNATIDEEKHEFVMHAETNLAVAVASDRGLVVPVIRSVHRMPLREISRALHDITARAREGKLTPADSKGGTFTLSSTGSMEQARLTSTRPIINPPQAAILWVSRICDRPCVKDGELIVTPMMNCSLSFDHRYIDGAESITFINDIARFIENPELAFAE